MCRNRIIDVNHVAREHMSKLTGTLDLKVILSGSTLLALVCWRRDEGVNSVAGVSAVHPAGVKKQTWAVRTSRAT
jgi:hypothetical protein